MNREVTAYEEGANQARRELSAGRIRLFSGAPSQTSWGIDLAETLKSRFGVEVEFTSDIVTKEQSSFTQGHNAVIEAHIALVHGREALAKANEEVQERRLKRYEALRANM